MTNTQRRHTSRMHALNKAKQLIAQFGPQAAYTFLMRRGFSIEACGFVVFGAEHEIL